MYPYPNMTVIYPLYHSLCYNLTANTYRLMPASNPLFRCIGSLYWSHDIFSFFPYTIRSGTISISIAWIWWDTVSWKVVYRTIKRYCFVITTIFFSFFCTIIVIVNNNNNNNMTTPSYLLTSCQFCDDYHELFLLLFQSNGFATLIMKIGYTLNLTENCLLYPPFLYGRQPYIEPYSLMLATLGW